MLDSNNFEGDVPPTVTTHTQMTSAIAARRHGDSYMEIDAEVRSIVEAEVEMVVVVVVVNRKPIVVINCGRKRIDCGVEI
jgi:hypothetical protein